LSLVRHEQAQSFAWPDDAPAGLVLAGGVMPAVQVGQQWVTVFDWDPDGSPRFGQFEGIGVVAVHVGGDFADGPWIVAAQVDPVVLNLLDVCVSFLVVHFGQVDVSEDGRPVESVEVNRFGVI
jgi:hypothetical protein